MAHLLETSSSDFLWGFLIAWYLENSIIKISPVSEEIHFGSA